MVLNEGDRAIIREIAFAVGEKISADTKLYFADAIKLHMAECPAQKVIEQGRGAWKLAAGIWAVIGGLVVALAGELILRHVN